MRKLTILTVAAIIMASCGGGSTKSGLKKNEHLGKIPALYTDYNLATKAYNEASRELNTRINETNSSEARAALRKEGEKYERTADRILTEVESELDKIDGKGIPFFCSESLEKLNLEMEALYFTTDKLYFTIKMQVSFVARQDFVVNINNETHYGNIYYHIVANDGSVIHWGRIPLVYLQYGQPVTITKGQTLSNSAILNVDKRPECWAEFAGILFFSIDDKESEISNEETCMGPEYMWQY